MRIALLAVIVYQLLVPSDASGAAAERPTETCASPQKFALVSGTVLSQAVGQTSFVKCHQLCLRTRQCRAYSYEAAAWRCTMFSAFREWARGKHYGVDSCVLDN